ncbi:hypothetical protein H8D64_02190 [PVC group bacterium]|nr:hypothetical protein [PVC group bacterium]
MKQVAQSRRAYPLMDLASLLLSKPDWCFVKLEVTSDARDVCLYQCKTCRSVSLSRSSAEAHFLDAHVGEYFDTEEITSEPPAGTFVCVAKCGISGKYLGPPNHHSYAETVKRVHSATCPHMPFDDYKDKIEMLHEPEEIEKWKQEACKHTVYKRKGAPENADAESVTWTEVMKIISEEIVPSHIIKTKKASIPESAAKQIKDFSIKQAVRDAWHKENRFPLQLSFALRAAFRHKHLHTFKAGKDRGINFVTPIKPAPLDPEHAIESIHDVLTYLRDHPGCKLNQMVEDLRPGKDMKSGEVAELLSPLHWLIDKGHIIEFFNGTFSVPLGR